MNRHQPLALPPPHNCSSTSGFHNRSRGCSALVFKTLGAALWRINLRSPSLPHPSLNFSF